MDYTDIYLRQRRNENTAPQTQLSSAGVKAATEQRVERVLKGAFSVQELVDRIEGLSTRVDAFDEKIVNLTRLVKFAQGLQEDKEGDLRRQQHELRSRIKRQEQITAQLQEEIAILKEKVPSAIRETVKEAQQENRNEMIKVRKESEEQLYQLKIDLEEAVKTVQKDLEQNVITVQREITTSASSQKETQNGLSEQLSLLEEAVRRLEASRVTTESTRLASVEATVRQMSDMLDSLQPKAAATSRALEVLGEERQRTHDAIMNEIESTREWTTRNLQRVKQHVETISTDVVRLRHEQADVAARLNSVSCQADVEYKKLRTLLQLKSREADALGSLVGKELGRVEDMNQRHQGLRTEPGALKGMAF
ncbi:putative basal body component [Trypanosoma cruzi]|uniref:NUP-1 protein n=1 Tax=Trypanosoma cruzi TaxID=5693 RepID=A0A7J6YEZ1_TRYCR|nr:hypothetical protein ECC02_001707 [Trypanosoma cruzi]KAF8293461.1 putative basal body component [Trypanosoma cruzi]